MTNQEAMQECLKIQAFAISEKQVEAMQTAIKALEQEPSGDAISRTDVLALCKEEVYKLSYERKEEGRTYRGYDEYRLINYSKLQRLPSVKQEPKTGHWVYDDECHEHGHCSECGYGRVDLVNGEPHNFCRRCGAKMKSEDKG